MTERNRRGVARWIQVALAGYLLIMLAWKAIDDPWARLPLAAILIFSAYVFGHVTGFRSANQRQPRPDDRPTMNDGGS
ncbi:hypothetical protein [Streptomyces sp. 142MFCol3.1]|uniref:hypothetical protein n=1 Tax=Streptomyces sp. 142MFCol3.1 TaxID=1172179 RepID=UPI00048C8E46|nr:hypothetical protein [Streptomyces sp. 142MFCol3.1]